MKFNKERFKEYWDFFSYSKNDLKRDCLWILGKIKIERDFYNEFYADDFRDFHSKDGDSIYYYSNISILDILTIPFRLLGILVAGLCFLMVLSITLPIAIFYNLYI